MAKLALINREEKRAKTVAKYAAKRAELFAVINDVKLSDEERMDARLKLQQLPRNASPSRQRNRCALTGRPPARLGGTGSARVAPRARDRGWATVPARQR